MVAEIAKHKEMPQYFNPENTDCEVVLGLLSLFVHAKVNFTFVYASKAAFKRYECFDKRLQLHSYEGCEAPSMKELLTLLHDANETYSTSASQAGTLCTLLPLDASSSATLPSDASLLSPPPTAVVGPVFIEPVFEPTGPHAQLVSSMIRSCYLYVHDFSRIHCSYTVKLSVMFLLVCRQMLMSGSIAFITLLRDAFATSWKPRIISLPSNRTMGPLP